MLGAIPFNYTKKALSVLIFSLLFACNPSSKKQKKQEAKSEPTETVDEADYTLKRVKEDSCFCEAKPIRHAFLFGDSAYHWQRSIELPLEGQFTEESHYVTSNDKFPENRLFANTANEQIDHHLDVSLSIYRDFDPDVTKENLYGKFWQREWTPAEGGAIGQGSVGSIQVEKLNPAMELWLMNMMWANGERPEMGTKFLLQANGKAVIVVAGFETGPAQELYIGGVTPEVHHWLGTDRSSKIKISYLKNQNFPYGPVECLGDGTNTL